MKSSKGRFWLDHFDSLKNITDNLAGEGILSGDAVETVRARVRATFTQDMDTLEGQAGFLFCGQDEKRSFTRETVELFRLWSTLPHNPSLAVMAADAAFRLDLEVTDQMARALLLAGILGEIPSALSYHNNLHYRKVFLNLIRLVMAHNDIYEGTGRVLNVRQIVLLFIAACIHDLGHDGIGNTVNSVFQQGRLERQSFNLAQPYLKTVGLETTDLDALQVMILGTEVTPLDADNPMKQVKAAYRYHFMGGREDKNVLSLSPDLEPLQKNPSLVMMSLLLHEADIATSAGLTYEITKHETAILMEEMRAKDPRPQHVLNFLNQICMRRFLSDAGQRLHGANMARIYALVEEDIKRGNEAFPASDKSEFITKAAA